VAAEALTPLAALVPLGVSPFLALGLFGAAASFLGFGLPASLAVLASPFVWGGLLVLAVLLKGGRSFKLTKPLAEMAGTSESLVGFVTLAMMLLGGGVAAAPPPAGPAEASLLGTAALAVAALTGLVAITVVRMGFDLLTWLSPIPFVDALLQAVKLVVTVALVAVAVFLPVLALPLNVVLLVVAVLAARWLLRVSRFVWAVIVDRAVGTFSPSMVAVEGRSVGPVSAWAVTSGAGFRRFAPSALRWSAEAGWTGKPGTEWADDVDLGPSTEATLRRGLLGTTLLTPRCRFFITARWGAAVDVLSSETGTPLMGARAAPVMRMKTI
jgi:hypothetical protein